MERAKKRESAVNSVNRALEILENPYDTMDIVQKKTHALFLYSKRQLEAIQRGDRVSGSRAKLLSNVAEIVGVTSRTMSNWLNAFQAQEEVRASKRGKLYDVVLEDQEGSRRSYRGPHEATLEMRSTLSTASAEKQRRLLTAI